MSDLGLRTFPGPILVSFLIPILVSGIYSKIACDNEMVACSARCLLPAAMPEHCPHVCCVKIMFGLLLTKFVRFHNDEFDEMPCKLDSTENPRSIEKYPTLP